MAMTCAEFLRLLDEDGPIDGRDAKAHVQSCAPCRGALARWEAVRRELRSMKEEPAPPFLHSRVMIHVRTAAPERKGWGFFSWSRVPWAGPLLAAALLIFLGGYGLLVVLEPGKQTPQDSSARRAEEISKLKEGLPPMSGPSKTAVEKQYDDLLTRADADKKEAEKPKHPLSKEEAPLHFSGLKQEAEQAQKDEEANVQRQDAAQNVQAPEAFAPAPQPAAPPALEAGKAAGPAQFAQNAPPAPAGNVNRSQAPAESQAQNQNALAGQDRRLRTESSKGAAAARAATVVCVLVRSADAARFDLSLPTADAPPSGAAWSLVLNRDGSVARADGHAVTAALSDAVTALHLPPGRYTLQRAP
jgi:hypothetical protein